MTSEPWRERGIERERVREIERVRGVEGEREGQNETPGLVLDADKSLIHQKSDRAKDSHYPDRRMGDEGVKWIEWLYFILGVKHRASSFAINIQLQSIFRSLTFKLQLITGQPHVL